MSGGYADVTEYVNWKDGGCDLSPSCLNCPRPKCIEEEPRGRQKMRLDSRAAAMKKMIRQGMRTRQIAGAFQVTMRTVQRALYKRKKRRNGNGRRKNNGL